MGAKPALPGLATGALGLIVGVVAFAFEQPTLGALSGLLALAAGVAGIHLAQQLQEQNQMQRLIEDELRQVRSEAQEAEERLQTEATAARSYQRTQSVDYSFDSGADALTDPSTGLFSQSFFAVALESRVAAARRHLRPVAIVLLEVVEGLPQKEPNAVKADMVADAIRVTLREADTACRLQNGYFALLLEDTPENGAIWTVERIRRKLLVSQDGLTLWAGVACYPAHAFSPDEIMVAAELALESAREWRQDRIEVAISAAD